MNIVKYRIVYRRSMAEDADNGLRGSNPGKEMDFFADESLCEWTTAILEGKSDKGGPYEILGNVFKYEGPEKSEPIVRVVTKKEIIDFYESYLIDMFKKHLHWSERTTFGRVTRVEF